MMSLSQSQPDKVITLYFYGKMNYMKLAKPGSYLLAKLKFTIMLIFSMLFMTACNKSTEVLYLDKNYPGLEPQIYAPGILSLPDRFEHGLTIHNSGQEHYFGLDGGRFWTYNGIACLKRNKDGTFSTDTLHITENIKYKSGGLIAGEPHFSLDKKEMYFVADYPSDIWKVKVDENGEWKEPVKLDSAVNSESSEWFPFIGYDNCLYFARDIEGEVTIYKAELVNGEYKKVSRFPAIFNYQCGDQVFPRHMNYIIFTSVREGGYGEIDIYVAFKKKNEEWTDGYNLGSKINTPGFELAPYISPDEKYLFFTRRDSANNATSSDIYWVSLDIVSKIKKGIE
jgi:hypothetical protein